MFCARSLESPDVPCSSLRIAAHFFGGVGGTSVGRPRAWFLSSSIKCFRKPPDRFGSAAATISFGSRLPPDWASESTCRLALPERLARIPAIAKIFDGSVYPADAAMEPRASQDLLDDQVLESVSDAFDCLSARESIKLASTLK